MPTGDPMTGLDGLMLAARTLVDGLYAGRHASPLRGAGVEFHDYRPYAPGDDLRAIDWKLYGRTNRYYLKRFRQETDLNLHLAVDTTASMDFAALDARPTRRATVAPPQRSPVQPGGQAKRGPSPFTSPTKLDTAKRLAAALATLAVRQGDRAGLSLFDTKLRGHHPASGSPRRLQQMVADLDRAGVQHGKADLGGALQQLGGLLGRRGLVAVVSDLLDEPEPLLRAIDRLRHAGSEVIVFQVLTPDELDLGRSSGRDRRRGLLLTDPEVDASVPTDPAEVARRYARLVDAHLSSLRKALAARDTDYTLVRTDRPLIDAMRRYLLIRAKRCRV